MLPRMLIINQILLDRCLKVCLLQCYMYCTSQKPALQVRAGLLENVAGELYASTFLGKSGTRPGLNELS